MSAPIYHLALSDEWVHVVDSGHEYCGSTLGKSLAEEGFIHCSFTSQVDEIANSVYRGRDDVLLLTIDPSLIPSPIRVESLDGGAQEFPHIYGPLPVAAVVRVASIPLKADGHLAVTRLLKA